MIIPEVKMKEQIVKQVKSLRDTLIEISDFIGNHPELGNQEFQAVEKLTSFLKANGFSVETNYLDIPTAFKAVYESGKAGPSIAYLCEYDALPEIGHGCGHNMIGTMSAGAAVALSEVLNEIDGRVVVFGTPAEETNGAKVALAEKGAFNDIDAAMILHPGDKTTGSGVFISAEETQLNFQVTILMK
jgi:amidohydrolase